MSDRLKVMVGVRGLAGHALPAIALAQALNLRGHDVAVQTSGRWSEMVEDLGLRFLGGCARIDSDRGASGGQERGVLEVARSLRGPIRDFGPDLVVSDALTVSPALAAEAEGVRRAILFPGVYPVNEPGLPFFSLGLLPPRTRLGALGWRALGPLLWRVLPSTRWFRWVEKKLDAERAELGIPPRSASSLMGEQLTLVATFPQLEYRRRWPADVHVTGPMILEPPQPEVDLPHGTDPLVVVAPSTVKDLDRRLVRVALDALAGERVRMLVTMSGAGLPPPGSVPDNAKVVDWVSYPQVMPKASLVVCSGGSGTVARALASGVPLVVVPAMPDDAEHGARVAWARVGLMIPGSLLGPGSLRLAALRVLTDQGYAARARAIAAWGRRNDGAARGAELVESYAAWER